MTKREFSRLTWYISIGSGLLVGFLALGARLPFWLNQHIIEARFAAHTFTDWVIAVLVTYFPWGFVPVWLIYWTVRAGMLVCIRNVPKVVGPPPIPASARAPSLLAGPLVAGKVLLLIYLVGMAIFWIALLNTL